MLSTLHIKNIGIIDDLSINFEEGFNVLTGETGAGKTLIIGSLAILSGGRFSKEMIRKEEECSLIEASIFVPQSEFAEDGNIIISREVYSNGRNTCKVNGNLVTVSELKRVMSKIIDIHGQHDNQNLLDNTKHIVYLDSFIGDELFKMKQEYQEYFNKYNEIKNKLKNNYGDETEKTRRLDLLRYQYNEIDVANLKIGEDLELEEKHNIMMNSEKLKENLEEIDEKINSNAIEYISNSIRCLEKIEDYGEIYKSKLAELKSIYYELQETARDLSSLKDEANFDEYERDEVERRLDIIFSLKRKYGNSIEEILEYKSKLAEEIEQIENVEEINKKLRIEQKEIETLWEHGIVKIKKTTGYDNVGAYFSVQLKHHAPIAETIDKQHAKSERLLFYPPNKRFYGYSKGIAKPIIFCTTYQEALKLVDEKYLTYSSSMEIDLEYENADEKVTINRIHRRQYNKKRTRKGE